MPSFSYAWNELRRRLGRTIVTAVGLAAGVGLVMGIVGVSAGLSDAQNKVLSPLSSVGTDIIVTRTVAPTSSTATTTTTPGGAFAGGPPGGGGGFFARGLGGVNAGALNASDANTLLQANSSVITDLAKLGKPGTEYTHDFFVPGTLVTFPAQAVGVVSKIPGVTSSVGALSLQALHETGTVPKITDTFTTGGQTITQNLKPPTLTAAEQAAERTCIQQAVRSTFGSAILGSGSSQAPAGNSGAPVRRSDNGTRRRLLNGFASNPAVEKCLTPAQQDYLNKVVVPRQTIQRVLAAPTTNLSNSSYTVAGVDPADATSGLITKSQLVKGSWFGAKPEKDVLVAQSYANAKHLGVGSTLTIDGQGYDVVGIVNPTLTGDVADVYFDLATLQGLSSSSTRVNEVLVSVAKSTDVDTVAAAIKKDLPGAVVLTSKSLADQVTGSLANAHKLANDLGGALAVVVLLAAFLIAGLLTLSSVAKRTREIGSLRAIGWSRAAVVRQVITETLGIGVLGAVVGVGLGVAICAAIGAIGPGLSVQSTGLAVGASSLSGLVGQSTTSTMTTTVHLSAPIHLSAVLLGIAGAILGGLLAGAAGGWRASRLSPAVALRDLG